jgi:hypothetical protein
VYQLGRGSEPVIVVGSMMSLVPRYIFAISQNAERDFSFSQAGGIAYRLSANSKKSRRQRPSAHRMRSIGLGDRPDGRQAMNSAGDAAKIKPRISASQAGRRCAGLCATGYNIEVR